MKKTSLLIFLVLVLVLSACSNSDTGFTKTADAEEAGTAETMEEAGDEEMTDEETESEEIDIVSIMQSNVFLVMDRHLYFEYEVFSEGEKANMSTYLTPAKMRVDTDPGSSENIIAIYDFETDETFSYVPSEGYGVTMSDVELFEDFDYQMEMMEYAEDIVNVERTTLGDWEVIFGEAEVDGGHIRFWYSEEYAVMMKYVVLTPEGEQMYFMITHIEMPDSVDAALFEKPDDIMFFNLDESSDSLIDQYFGE